MKDDATGLQLFWHANNNGTFQHTANSMPAGTSNILHHRNSCFDMPALLIEGHTKYRLKKWTEIGKKKNSNILTFER